MFANLTAGVRDHAGTSVAGVFAKRIPAAWKLLFVAVLVVLSLPAAQAQTAVFNGTNMLGLGGNFSSPQAVAVDSHGNVYVANYSSTNLLFVDIFSNVGVFEMPAGCTQTSCVIQLGGSYTQPDGLAVDSQGNVYVSDYSSSSGVGNGYVYEIPAGCTATEYSSGICSVTQLGPSFGGARDVAVDSHGNVFVATVKTSDYLVYTSRSNVNVYEMPPGCTAQRYNETACATMSVGSGWSYPVGVAVDSADNLYVNDPGNHLVYEIPAGQIQNGTGASMTPLALLTNPWGLAVDSFGNVFAADQTENLIYKISAGCSLGEPCVAPLGYAFSSPQGVAVDGSGNVYVADTDNEYVWEFTPNSANFSSVPVGSTSTVSLNFTFSAAGALGTPVVLTEGAAQDAQGKPLDFAVNTALSSCLIMQVPGVPCTVAATFTPRYPGLRRGTVELVNSPGSGTGSVVATANVYGTGTGPQVVISPSTQSTLNSGLQGPGGVAVDGADNIYVADFANGTVSKIPAGGGSSIPLGSGYTSPFGVAVDGGGNVYVAGNGSVSMIPAGGGSSLQMGGGFNSPRGVAVDGAGNVYVADADDGMVSRIPAGCTAALYQINGCTVTALGGGFDQPSGVAVDGGGNVYVADAGGAVSMIPAGCTASSSCVKALGGSFIQPLGVAVDGGGNIYVADHGNGANGAVSEINRVIAPTLNFAETTDGAESSNSPQAATLANIGNAALTFPGANTGYNPSITANFTLDSSTTCPVLNSTYSTGTLAPDDTCTLAVDFVPQATGSITGSLVVTDNNLNAAAPNYATQSISLSGTVGPPLTAATAIASQSLILGVAANFTPVTASGGTAPLSYSITPALPAGLGINSSTGAITGTPTVISPAAIYAVRVTDTNGSTAQASFLLTVNTGVTATAAIASLSLTSGAVANFTPVTGSGGMAPLSYSIAPALPAGLNINPSTGTIAGTPTVVQAATNYMVTVTDAAGGTAQAGFSLAVNPPLTATTAIASQSLTSGAAASFTPVTASGGTPPLSYRITPTLPAGLSINSSTGAITGTPTVTSPATIYTVKVTDTNGAAAYASFLLTTNLALSPPSIASLSPALIKAGSAAFALTVNGSNFTPAATVLWNGSSRATTFVSASQLTASITAEDIATMGEANITVVDSDNGGISPSFVFAIDTAAGMPGYFTVSVTTANLNVAPGGTTQLPVTLTGVASGAAVTASCVNLPLGATCTYSNNGVASINSSAGMPAGSYSVTVIFQATQNVAQQTTAMMHRVPPYLAGWLGLGGLPLGWVWIGGKRKKLLRRCLMLLAGLSLLMYLAGCGGRSSSTTTTLTTQTSMEITLTVN